MLSVFVSTLILYRSSMLMPFFMRIPTAYCVNNARLLQLYLAVPNRLRTSDGRSIAWQPINVQPLTARNVQRENAYMYMEEGNAKHIRYA